MEITYQHFKKIQLRIEKDAVIVMARNWLPWAKKQVDKRFKKAQRDEAAAKNKKKTWGKAKKKPAPKPKATDSVASSSSPDKKNMTITSNLNKTQGSIISAVDTNLDQTSPAKADEAMNEAIDDRQEAMIEGVELQNEAEVEIGGEEVVGPQDGEDKEEAQDEEEKEIDKEDQNEMERGNQDVNEDGSPNPEQFSAEPKIATPDNVKTQDENHDENLEQD